MREKKGIIIVSFGTSYGDTELKCIVPIEDAAKKIFKDFEVRRAFTSKMIIKKLARAGKIIPTPEEAVKKMVEEGFTHLIVQPLHFMKGNEYHDKIVEPLLLYRDNFEGFIIGEPLLSGESDFERVVSVIEDLSASVSGEQILLMGHGTDHPSDSVYSTLQERLDDAEINAKIATVEGSITLTDILPDLLREGTKQIHLFPLMLVAGDHARNDMAGDDKSWKIVLQSEGIEAIPHLQGMGEFMEIRQIFIRHIRNCKKELFPEKYRKMRKRPKVPKFYVVGMGPGAKEYILPSAIRAIKQSEILLGAEKLITPYTAPEGSKKGVPFTGSPEKFLDKLDSKRHAQRAAVLVSGDPGFYSLLGEVKRRFSMDEYEVIPGLAAYQLACARIGLPWQDFLLTSVHGRPLAGLDNLPDNNNGVIILTDCKNNPARISEYLKNRGWNDRTTWICENISYPEEKIEKYKLGEIPGQKEYKLCLMIMSPDCGE